MKENDTISSVNEEIVQNETLENQTVDSTQISDSTETDATESQQVLNPEDQLRAEIERLNQELSTKNDQLLRKVAEFENMRKRVERERYMTISLAKAEALNEFLPINDDLMRTIDSAKNLTVDEGFLKGVQLVAEKFENVLIKNGIEKINETGVPFDVNVHEALLRQPAPDSSTPSGTILQVFEAGYKMGDRVIRHAKVIVSE